MRTLGGTGIKVSAYCLGAMMFGQSPTPTPPIARLTSLITQASGVRLAHPVTSFPRRFVWNVGHRVR
jgi:hypothetical protein